MADHGMHPGMMPHLNHVRTSGTMTRGGAGHSAGHNTLGPFRAYNNTVEGDDMDSELVWVRPNPQNNDSKTVLWERDTAHPGPSHEIFIGAHTPPVQVARTRAVDERLGQGRLILSNESELIQHHKDAIRRQREAIAAEGKQTGDHYRLLAEKLVDEEDGPPPTEPSSETEAAPTRGRRASSE